jgi:hypothetical protein
MFSALVSKAVSYFSRNWPVFNCLSFKLIRRISIEASRPFRAVEDLAATNVTTVRVASGEPRLVFERYKRAAKKRLADPSPDCLAGLGGPASVAKASCCFSLRHPVNR